MSQSFKLTKDPLTFFHSFISDLSLSCEKFLEESFCREALFIASKKVIEKKKSNKIVSTKYSTKLNIIS